MVRKSIALLCVLVLLAIPFDTLGAAPAYKGSATIPLNDGVPVFTSEEITGEAYIRYDPLDKWQRATKV